MTKPISTLIRRAIREAGAPRYEFIATNKYKRTRSVKIYASNLGPLMQVPPLSAADKKIIAAVERLMAELNVPLVVKRTPRRGFGWGLPAIIFSYPVEREEA